MKQNRTKLIMVAAMASCIALAAVLAGCQSQGNTSSNGTSSGATSSSASSEAALSDEQSSSSAAQPVTGGWEVATNAVASQITSDQQASFAKAAEGYVGVSLQPVALLGTQVVAGTNSVYLCQGATATQNPEPGWYVVVVHEDLDGNSSITSVEQIDLADVKTADRFEAGLAGGWQLFPNESDAVVLPEDALGAWAQAADAHEGDLLTPIAVLGTQVVAGTNYLVLASSTDGAGATTLHLAMLYADLEGNGEITDDALFDLLAYV